MLPHLSVMILEPQQIDFVPCHTLLVYRKFRLYFWLRVPCSDEIVQQHSYTIHLILDSFLRQLATIVVN